MVGLKKQKSQASENELVGLRFVDSPVGQLLIVAGINGVREVAFSNGSKSIDQESSDDPKIILHLNSIESELDQYFAKKLKKFKTKLAPRGTDFELRAWKSLSSIPFGETRSYGEQARALGNANASRAVGGANRRNPIAIVVPCHRVIGANGSLTGFGGGIEKKKWLLDFEASQVLVA